MSLGPALGNEEKKKLKLPWMREAKHDYRILNEATEFFTADAAIHPDFVVTSAANALKKLAGDKDYEVIGLADKPSYPEMSYLKGLAMRSSASNKDDENVVRVLKKGTPIRYVEQDDTWAQLVSPSIPGVAKPLFVWKGALSDEQVVEITTFDEVVVERIRVKAGDILGYPGPYAMPDCPATPMVHLEVFADENLTTFMSNKAKEGTPEQKIVIKIECGKELKKREELHQGQGNADAPVARWTKCKVTHPCPYTKHSKVELMGREAVVERGWLGTYAAAQKGYPAGDKDKIKAAFGGIEIPFATTVFKLVDDKVNEAGEHVAKGTAFRRVSLDFAEKKTVFVKKTDLPRTDKGGLCLLDAPIAATFTKNPDQYKFTAVAHKLEWNEYRDLKEKRDAEVVLDEADAPWIEVNAKNAAGATVSGWIKLADIKEESVFDWPHFQVIKETADDDDGLYDLGKQSPFFKNVVKAIDSNRDGIFSDAELLAAHKDPVIAEQTSRLVCLHPSEWQSDAKLEKWKAMEGAPNYEETRKLISKLVWWDEVKAKLAGFVGPNVYHVHPLAFIEQMTKYVAGTRLTEADKLRVVKVIAEFESGGAPYTAANLDTEFEGYSDLPKGWHKDKTVAQPSAFDPDVAYSKYSDNPRHVGLSFGLIQFTQEGSLGVLLKRMRETDPDKFSEVFGEHAQELLNTLTATGAPTTEEEEVFDNTGASMGKKLVSRRPSVQPVAGHEVWDDYWVSKFKASGAVPAFQECQRTLAVEDYLDVFLDKLRGEQLSEKTLAFLYDRSVNQGQPFAKKLATRVRDAHLDTVAKEKSFWEAYIAGTNKKEKLIIERLVKVQNSALLSWERRYAL